MSFRHGLHTLLIVWGCEKVNDHLYNGIKLAIHTGADREIRGNKNHGDFE